MSPASLDPDPPRAPTPRARRRPGLVALLYGYRALAGLLLALPAVVALGTPTASFPRRQGELFDPGGVMLIESLRLNRRALVPIETSAGIVAAVALLAGIVPLAVLLAGLDREGRLSGARLAGRAFAHAGTLALITVLGALLQLVTSGVVMVLGGKVVGALGLVRPAEDLAHWGLLAVVLGVVLVAGVLRDLASAAAVRGDHGLYVASARALHCARHAGGRALFAWAWRGALGLFGIVVAALLAPALAGASAGAIAVGVVLHQAAIAGATLGRASWLAAAMRLYDATEPRVEEAVTAEVPVEPPAPPMGEEPAGEAAPDGTASPAEPITGS
jgi:hypothetical protein